MTETTPEVETSEEEISEEVVLETQDCDCDTSTRQSGFCPHGNNV